MNKAVYILSLITLVLIYPSGLKLFFGYQESFLYPTLLSHLPLVISILIAFFLKNFFLRFLLFLWIGWLFIGEAFILSYYKHNPYYISQEEGCFIYSLFIAFLSIGMMFSGIYFDNKIKHSINLAHLNNIFYDVNFLEYTFILYPFVWIAIIYSNVGFIPILAGKDVTDQMYELNYGYIHGYGLFNCMSAMVIYHKLRNSNTLGLRLLWMTVLLLVTLIMCFDSKRMYLLVTLFSIFVYEKRITKSFKLDSFTLLGGFVGLLLYSMFQIVRLGNTSLSTHESKGLPLGVEFREFIRTVNSFEPGSIKNYDLFMSTLGSVLNSFVLEGLGYSKAELLKQDSASAWMKLFEEDNNLGIRTGIISEVYFSYGYNGLFIMFAIGISLSVFCNKLMVINNFSNLILVSILYGLTILTIFGQLSVWAGCLTLVAYLYILINTAKFFFQVKENSPVPFNSEMS